MIYVKERAQTKIRYGGKAKFVKVNDASNQKNKNLKKQQFV